MLLRFLAFASVLVVIGVYAPRFAPGLVSGLADEPGEVREVKAAPPPEKTVELALSPRKVALVADRRGHFSTIVLVNGRQVEVMIDTGATVVALNEATASKLGIKPPRRAFTEQISTSNGVIKAAPVVLSDIRLGGIRMTEVHAVVVPGKALPINLLGMSFLSRLSSFEVTRDRLVLVD
jgi:aspartyl protease family protein